MTVKIALRVTPNINTSKKTRCMIGCRLVSNTDNRINPTPPKEALDTAQMDRITSARCWAGRRRFECWRSLSDASVRTKNIAVTDDPATNNGLRVEAPMSDMSISAG